MSEIFLSQEDDIEEIRGILRRNKIDPENYQDVSLARAGYRLGMAPSAIEALAAILLVEERRMRAWRVAEAAFRLCEEIQEDADGVPQEELKELNDALDEFWGPPR